MTPQQPGATIIQFPRETKPVVELHLVQALSRAAKGLDIAADAAADGHELARLGKLPLYHQSINGAAALAAAHGLLALLDAEGARNLARPLRAALCAYIEEVAS